VNVAQPVEFEGVAARSILMVAGDSLFKACSCFECGRVVFTCLMFLDKFLTI